MILEVDALSVGFGSREGFTARRRVTTIVESASFSVDHREIVGVVGESGSGKSTVARGVLRLLPIVSGSVLLDGTDITTMPERELRVHRRKMQMVFQDPYSSLNPSMNIGQIVMESSSAMADRPPKNQRREEAAALLASVGLGADAMTRHPHEFSGGQRQRIAIARALATKPELLICDEAVSALDVTTQHEVLRLLGDLRDQHALAMLFISHDLGVVRRLADRVVIMFCGQIVEAGPAEEIFSAPAHPYTVALLAAAPVPNPRGRADRKRVVLTGDVPNPIDPPTGCRFHARCPAAMPICSDVEPENVSVEGRSVKCHLYSIPPDASRYDLVEDGTSVKN